MTCTAAAVAAAAYVSSFSIQDKQVAALRCVHSSAGLLPPRQAGPSCSYATA
jgi:hypothetical protein